MDEVRAVPGDWVGLIGPQAWLLAELDPADAGLLRCWSAVRAGGNAMEVLAALAGDDLNALPSFALVHRAPSGTIAVIARGSASVAIVTPDGRHAVTASDLQTWREVSAPAGANRFVLEAGGAAAADDQAPNPANGIVLASRVEVETSPAQGVPGAPPPAAVPPAAPVAAPPVAPVPVGHAPSGVIGALPVGGTSATYAGTIGQEQFEQPATGIPEILVESLECEHGHLNPLTTTVCRVCGSQLPSQVPVRVPRPSLGMLRFSTGEVVSLDRPIAVGRNPDARPGYSIVRLGGNNPDVSRNHAEVTLDGWQVLITDISTNGTVVTPPWEEPQRLQPHRPFPIEPGTVVSLSDDMSFQYEVGQ